MKANTKIKLCKDCIYLERNFGCSDDMLCNRKTKVYTNLVDGNTVSYNHIRCKDERKANFIDVLFGACGKNGRFWKRKQ